MRALRTVVSAAALAACSLLPQTGSLAQFIEDRVPDSALSGLTRPAAQKNSKGVDTPLGFHRRLRWGFSANAEKWPDPPNHVPDPAQEWWLAEVSAAAINPLMQKEVTIKMQHKKAPPGIDHAFDEVGDPIEIKHKRTRPAAGAKPFAVSEGFIQSHGTTGHYDAFRYAETINPPLSNPPALLDLAGTHVSNKEFFWSYTHQSDVARKVTVTVSYPDGTEDDVDQKNVNKAGQRVSGKLPSKMGMLPSDYLVLITGSGKAATHLRFPGFVDGVAMDMPLSLMAESFAGFDEFLVPAIFDETLDFDIDVNLIQWLTFMPDQLPFGPLTLTGGANDMLPGFMVLNHATGLPFSGQVNIEGFIDGQSVPEPGAIALLVGLAIPAALYARRRRTS